MLVYPAATMFSLLVYNLSECTAEYLLAVRTYEKSETLLTTVPLGTV